MALTLDKVKAKELRKENGSEGKSNKNGSGEGQKRVEDYLPKEDALKEIKEKYKVFNKSS